MSLNLAAPSRNVQGPRTSEEDNLDTPKVWRTREINEADPNVLEKAFRT
jgi:hypothetical protein